MHFQSTVKNKGYFLQAEVHINNADGWRICVDPVSAPAPRDRGHH
jgi:hypothetical protein